MGLIKEILEAWRIEKDKRRQQEQKYRIEYAFTSGGTKYYRYADIANLPYERGFMALNTFNELQMRCSREYLIQHTDAMDKLLHEQKIDIFKIQKLVEMLKQRLTMPTEVDLMYKLASIVYFDKSENPAVYEPAYAEKKIAKWRKDQGVRDFFMQKPLLELMQSSKNVDIDLDIYTEMNTEINKIHQECLRIINSTSK